jgi:RNA ligase
MKFTNELLNEYVEKRLLNRKKHEIFDYYIYDYTPKVQFEKMWDEVTLACRGLILDGKNNIVARPFTKFFNWEETPDADFSGKFDCFEKADGSLGIAYLGEDGEIYFSTRGSFYSEQAKEALKIYEETFSEISMYHLRDKLKNGWTELFEIIYPENRIVVDYKGARTLKYLGSINKDTGSFDFDNSFYTDFANYYGSNMSLDRIKNSIDPEEEGYVLRFDNGLVCKMKGAEYVRLHRLLTNVSGKNIWEVLSIGGSLDSFLENVPDEFYNWVKNTRDRILKEYSDIENYHLNFMKTFGQSDVDKTFIGKPSRKDLARLIKQKSDNDKNIIPPICFAVLDNKDYTKYIWKLVKPGVEKPFKDGVE